MNLRIENGVGALPVVMTTPAPGVPALAATMALPVKAEGSFMDFATTLQSERPRPSGQGIERSTAEVYERKIRQMAREIHDGEDHFWRYGPDWSQIMTWANRGGDLERATRDGHRKALAWLAAYWGQYGPQGRDQPPFIAESWAPTKLRTRAQEAGIMTQYADHFDLPRHIQEMLAATPNEDNLRKTKAWGNRQHRREVRYLDDLFHTLVLFDFYTGARVSELAQLKQENYRPDLDGFVGWRQTKKHGKERAFVVPETAVLHSRVDPSIDRYLIHVRPKVARSDAPTDALFLNTEGRAFTPKTLRKFLSESIHAVLGPAVPGPHGFRRGCATWRFHHGWTLTEVARFIDDTEQTTQGYLNRVWLEANEATSVKTRQPRPRTPLIRSKGKKKAEEGEQA